MFKTNPSSNVSDKISKSKKPSKSKVFGKKSAKPAGKFSFFKKKSADTDDDGM
jgi:hypothetical protein